VVENPTPTSLVVTIMIDDEREIPIPTAPGELTPAGHRSGAGVASLLQYLNRALRSKPKAEPPSTLQPGPEDRPDSKT
jgi:hypothetical protein